MKLNLIKKKMNYFGSTPPTSILLFLCYIIKTTDKKKKKMCGVYIYDTLGISTEKLKLFTSFNSLMKIIGQKQLFNSCLSISFKPSELKIKSVKSKEAHEMSTN